MAPARCWSADDWKRIEDEEFGKRVNLAGFATLDYGSLNLSPLVCDALARIVYTEERPTGVEQLEISFAFVVVMHETSHLADGGQFSSTIGKEEPAAECWGIQHVQPAAEALGAGKAYAAELAKRYWTDICDRGAPGREGGKRLHEWRYALASFREPRRERRRDQRGLRDPRRRAREAGSHGDGEADVQRGEAPWEGDPKADGWWGDEQPSTCRCSS